MNDTIEFLHIIIIIIIIIFVHQQVHYPKSNGILSCPILGNE